MCGWPKVSGPRIVGGTTAIKGQWPWQVVLSEGTTSISLICGGTLISDQWVLTAAHCFNGKLLAPGRFWVTLGEHNRRTNEGTELTVQAAQIILHSQYVPTSMYNDIALVRLANRVNINANAYVNVACLPQLTDTFFTNARCYSTGWGLTQGVQDANVLQVVNSRVITAATCRQYFASVTDNTKICFGNGVQGACRGDSGGPLVCARPDGAFVLAGVVSFGTQSCVQAPFPTVYTNVAAYRGWIQAYTQL